MSCPYYQDDWVTIYHGDCLEWLPPASLLLTDPPYGLDLDTTHKKYKDGIDRPAIVGDRGPFDPGHLLNYERVILWGGNCYASRLPDFPGWLAWVKTARNGANIRQADMELAWTNFVRRPQVYRHLWIGAYKASESGQRNVHPSQKPVEVMKWCLSVDGGDGTVLDPYMGSGTTLVAAKDFNRQSIGIEIEERYCEVAANRCSQEVLALGS